MRPLSVNELAEWIADPQRPDPLLLDVREDWEFELCQIVGSQHLPMATLASQIDELDRDADTVLICHHGVRSAQVAYFLDRSGFSNVINLNGGVDAWSQTIDTSLRRY